MPSKSSQHRPLLLLGDAVAILLVIVIGLRFHQSQEMIAGRLAVNFLPFFLAWLLAVSAIGLLSQSSSGSWSQLWRVASAAALAAPLGAVVRGFWLGQPVLPIFVLVMGMALTIGILIWRAVYIGWVAPRRKTK